MHLDSEAGTAGPENPYVDVAAEVFRLLADATRIRIVLALQDGELSVNELATIVRRSPAGVSAHLAKMRWAKVVRARQDGTRFFYRLTDEHPARLVSEALRQAGHSVDERPAHHD